MSTFWSLFISVLTILSMIAIVWLLIATSRIKASEIQDPKPEKSPCWALMC